VQSAKHGKAKETHSAEKAAKLTELEEKTASEVKLSADIKLLTSAKVVAVIFDLRLNCTGLGSQPVHFWVA